VELNLEGLGRGIVRWIPQPLPFCEELCTFRLSHTKMESTTLALNLKMSV
jgi:hypothetical protein